MRRDVTSEHHVTRLPSLVRSFQEACFDGFLLRIRENLEGGTGLRLLRAPKVSDRVGEM